MSGWDEEIKKELGYCGKNVYIGKHVIFTNPKKVILHDNVRIDPFCLITFLQDRVDPAPIEEWDTVPFFSSLAAPPP